MDGICKDSIDGLYVATPNLLDSFLRCGSVSERLCGGSLGAGRESLPRRGRVQGAPSSETRLRGQAVMTLKDLGHNAASQALCRHEQPRAGSVKEAALQEVVSGYIKVAPGAKNSLIENVIRNTGPALVTRPICHPPPASFVFSRGHPTCAFPLRALRSTERRAPRRRPRFDAASCRAAAAGRRRGGRCRSMEWAQTPIWRAEHPTAYSAAGFARIPLAEAR